MELESRIGEVIVRLRGWRGMSQEQLALEAGIDRRYMSDLENGKRKVSLEMLGRLAGYFLMRPADLIELADSLWKFSSDTSGLSQWLCFNGYDQTVILESPDYLPALTGISHDGRLIYDYRMMIWYLIQHDGMDYEEAMEFIDYNTIRALDYMGPNAPIVTYNLQTTE